MRLAVTGLSSFVGARTVRRLLAADPDCPVIGLDLELPPSLEGRIAFHQVDLTEATADALVAEILQKEGCDTVLHAAFRSEPHPDLEYSHELEVLGSLHVLNAVGATRIERLVLPSTAEVYGPHPDNPNFLSEQHPLRGHPDAHAVRDRVEVERLVRLFQGRRASTRVIVLRAAAVLGPSVQNRFTRYFDRSRVSTLLGFDPLMQFLHEDDLIDAVMLALSEDVSGAFNLAGAGVLPLSTLLRLAGKRSLPLPHPFLYTARYLDSVTRTGDAPASLYDYLRFLWVVDTRRAEEELGFRPLYTTKEAWMSFALSRKAARVQ